MLRAGATAQPEAEAIAAPDRPPMNRKQLFDQTRLIGRQLNDAGIGRNDRVAIVLPNGPEMATAFLSVAAFATSAPLNPAYRAPEFEFYLSDLDAKAVVVHEAMNSDAVKVAADRNIPVLRLVPQNADPAGAFTLETAPGARTQEGGPAEAQGVALVLHTSGTTSRPKMVPLTHANICASARNVAASLNLTERDRCLNMMPLFHIHGLIAAVMASLTGGGSVVCTPGFDAERFAEWLRDLRPTWYSAVPTIHQAILSRLAGNREALAECDLRLIRSSSSALPPQVMAELEALFEAPVIEAYGMTEAAHQMTSNPLPPAPRKPGSVGLPAGPEVAIMDEEGKLLESDQVGEVVIRGPNVTSGYAANPEANAAAFTNGWFRTGDEGRFDGDGYLFLTGRIKEIINRGGEKISPREVDETLLDHPAVQQAVTFAMPHAALGEDIAAAVVLRDETTAVEDELRGFVADRVAEFKVPRRILILDEIPKGPTGKLQRIGLAEKLGLAGRPETQAARREDGGAPVLPRTVMERQLVAIWRSLLGVPGIGVTDDFFALGGYSLLAVELVARLEQVFSKKLPASAVLQAPTIEKQAEILIREDVSGILPTVVPLETRGARPPFFCIASREALAYQQLAKRLSPEQPFYVLHPLTRVKTDDPVIELPALAEHYAHEILRAQTAGACFLGGMCFGAIMAFETAQVLRRCGREVALILMVDPPWPTDGPLARSMRVIRRSIFDLRKMRRLGRDERKPYLAQRLTAIRRRLRAKRPSQDSAAAAALDEAYGHRIPAAYRRAFREYTPQPYPGRLILMLGADTPEGPPFDPRLKWARLAAEGTEICTVPGDHDAMLRPPHVTDLAAVLRQILADAHTGVQPETA